MEVASTAVGIASLGIQVCQGLISYCDDYQGYDSDITTIRGSVRDLDDTLGLLKESLDAGGLDKRRRERVESCLTSCNGELVDLDNKLKQLRKYEKPEGLRQKAYAEAQRLKYSFRKETLIKLQRNVTDVRERLSLGLQVLQLDTQRSDRWRKLADWLSPTDPWSVYESGRRRREPETGAWLLQSGQYQRWKSDASRHLWIYGNAGCGKTFLYTAAVEDIQSHCDTRHSFGLGLFLFSYSDSHRTSWDNLLRSLVTQLAWREPGLSSLQQAYDRPTKSFPTSDELERILISSLGSYDKVFLMLDALDESPQDDDTLNVRATMLEQLEQLMQKASNVKMLATSRELRDIRDSMSAIRTEAIPIAGSAVDGDIQRYVSTQLSNSRVFGWLDLGMKSEIEETITSKANGMFQWAHCQLQALRGLKSTKMKYIKETLRTLPKSLDQTYERMLCAIEEKYHSEALTLLQWLAYAESPPTLGELAEAAIVDPTMLDCEVDIDNRGDLEDTMNILSGLVTVTDGQLKYGDDSGNVGRDGKGVGSDTLSFERRTERFNSDTRVSLAHFSVKEYLESTRILSSPAKTFFLDSTAGHGFLAQSCLAYLAYYSDDGAKSLTESDLVTYPLLPYAARSWYYHASLQQQFLSRAVLMLVSEKRKLEWLNLHEPDINPKAKTAFTDPRDIGSPLYYASYLGLKGLVESLIRSGEDANEAGGFYGNALQAASDQGYADIVRTLIQAGAQVNAQGGYYGNALQAASFYGDQQIVDLLLQAGAIVSTQGGFLGNALQAAAAGGNKQIVQTFLDAGAVIGQHGGYSGTALQAASLYGHVDIIRTLLAAGADIHESVGEHGGALHAASVAGHEDAVEVLLGAGANVDAPGSIPYGHALFASAFKGHKQIVTTLLNAGADVNYQRNGVGTALQAASQSGQKDVVLTLLRAGARTDMTGGLFGLALYAASKEGHEEVVRILLDAGADVDARSGDAGTALHAASRRGRETVVRTLVSAGARMDIIEDPYGDALQTATIYGEEDVVRLLLKIGANFMAQGGFYGSALQAAAAKGEQKIAEMLVEAGASVRAQGGYYGNALLAASTKGHTSIVAMLLSSGADADEQPTGRTTSFDQDRSILWVLSDRSPQNTPKFRISNALQVASAHGWRNIVEMLLNAGADVNRQGGYYGNALRAAAVNDHIAVEDLLLSQGAQFKATTCDALGRTFVHIAAIRGYDLGERLVQRYNLDVNMSDNEGWTPLHWATYFGNVEVVRNLLAQSADQTLRDHHRRTPLDIAVFAGHNRIAKEFSEAGLDGETSVNPGQQLEAFCDSCNHANSTIASAVLILRDMIFAFVAYETALHYTITILL